VGVTAFFFWARKRPVRPRKIHLSQIAAVTVVTALAVVLWQQVQMRRRGELRRDRNFYGSLIIYSSTNPNTRMLVHGQTSHGYQFLDEPTTPTSYYGRKAGIGLFMDSRPSCPGRCELRYGLIGMGVGTLAAYGRPGEVMRYYEINPQVIEYSAGTKPYFTYVRDSAATVEIVQGDARLSLERELKNSGPQKFDVLVVDAFNNDSIPIHLLTQEAFQLYLAHLRSGGAVMAFHVSNRVLDLRPVLEGLAARNQMSYVRVNKKLSMNNEEMSDWVFMARDPDVLKLPAFQGRIAPMPPESQAILWTDEYSTLFKVLKHGGE
jgi:hypothetical protein